MNKSEIRRIALFGGSFDPPHLCHVLAATFALCRSEVDELRMIPTYQHAFDKALTAFDHRCEMLEAAVAHLGPKVKVDPIEAELGGTSYTIETVRAIKAQEPEAELLWVCGVDAWQQRRRWYAWEELQPLITPLIFGREGTTPTETFEVVAMLPAISSSALRDALKRRESISGLVPEGVERYITQHGLYG